MGKNNLNQEKYDKLIEIYEIKEYGGLLDIIKNNENIDLRKNFIFRGIKKSSYDLIPSSLRKENKYFKINDYILKSEFNFYLNKTEKIKMDGQMGTSFRRIIVDKNKGPTNTIPNNEVNSPGELHFKREIYVLLKFLDYADKIGLKIPTSASVRRWIHNNLSYENKIDELWPKPEFYEIISLAQHHGLPTRALDWTYDFKVALYFAVEGILENNREDCVLWAFNYKLFEDNYHEEKFENDKLVIYRPEYSINSNLKAQKGLFTFLTCDKYEQIDDETSFEYNLINNLKETECMNGNLVKTKCLKLNGFKEIEINDEKIFYKFIIPGKFKAKILEDLYLDGYAPENIYPNYHGVVKAMRKRAMLDNLLNGENDN